MNGITQEQGGTIQGFCTNVNMSANHDNCEYNQMRYSIKKPNQVKSGWMQWNGTKLKNKINKIK